jgi:hypothetical protein
MVYEPISDTPGVCQSTYIHYVTMYNNMTPSKTPIGDYFILFLCQPPISGKSFELFIGFATIPTIAYPTYPTFVSATTIVDLVFYSDSAKDRGHHRSFVES